LAHRILGAQPSGATLQPTAVVHEAYLHLARATDIDWQSKTHFFAVAATQVRRVLVDHQRKAAARKRGADLVRISFVEELAAGPPAGLDLLAIDEALTRLAERNPRQARVAELRLFAGMEFVEIGEAVGVTDRTAKQDWKVAKARLARALRPPAGKR
jgi:RNA polymerase sigma factor (TIGR02999 family)